MHMQATFMLNALLAIIVLTKEVNNLGLSTGWIIYKNVFKR